MTASFTLASCADTFPVGTSVGAYLARHRRDGASPSGTATDTATVASTGALTFDDLAHDTDYVAYASVNGSHKYRAFQTSRPRYTGLEIVGPLTDGDAPVWSDDDDALVASPVASGDEAVYRSRQIINVLDYVPAPVNIATLIARGSTTDFTDYDRAATAAAEEAGGGIILYPLAGDYFYDDANTETDNGVTWSIGHTVDNVTRFWVDGARSRWDGAQDLFFVTGYGKPDGMTSWGDYWLGDATTATYYAIDPITAGDREVTFTTAADAANVTKGQEMYPRSGQSVASSTTEPKAEILRAAADGDPDTGVVPLEWAAVHSYEQEYYISGTSGKTSTSVTANPAVFGMAVVDDRIVRNVHFANFQPYGTGTGKATRWMGVDNWSMTNVKGQAGNSLMDAIEHCHALWRDFDFLLDRPGAAHSDRWLVTGATGVTHFRVEGLIKGRAVGNTALIVHFHEWCHGGGPAKFDVQTVAGADGANLTVMSIRAGATVDLTGPIFLDSEGSASPLYIDDTCVLGGRIMDLRLARCTDATKGARVSAPGWTIRAKDGSVVVLEDGNARAPQTGGEIVWLRGILRHNTSEITLGELPANALILHQLISIDVRTAFTGTGTDRVTIGYDSGTNAVLASAAALDLGSGTGRKAQSDIIANIGALAGIHSGTRRTLKAYYLDQNADANAGKALIVVPYVRVPGLS